MVVWCVAFARVVADQYVMLVPWNMEFVAPWRAHALLLLATTADELLDYCSMLSVLTMTTVYQLTTLTVAVSVAWIWRRSPGVFQSVARSVAVIYVARDWTRSTPLTNLFLNRIQGSWLLRRDVLVRAGLAVLEQPWSSLDKSWQSIAADEVSAWVRDARQIGIQSLGPFTDLRDLGRHGIDWFWRPRLLNSSGREIPRCRQRIKLDPWARVTVVPGGRHTRRQSSSRARASHLSTSVSRPATTTVCIGSWRSPSIR